MKLALISDAWHPQVNGVVTTLDALLQQFRRLGVQTEVFHPGLFDTWACPGFSEIRLARSPYQGLSALLNHWQPDRIHIVTEGPLGWAARRYCLRHGLRFTTAYHTKFPETVQAAFGIPCGLGYALMRHFHAPSAGVLVPSRSVYRLLQVRGFEHLREWTHGVDLDQFTVAVVPEAHPALLGRKRPYALFAGRVSVEKSIEDFLDIPFEGTKFVAGDGPVRSALQKKYPDAVWLGRLDKQQLARAYRSADVLAFPSQTDTFGLVMLEAMASGTPVAARPVDGPLEVFEGVDQQGGVMHTQLAQALCQALAIPRTQARHHAMRFSWAESADQFLFHLVPAHTWEPLTLNHQR